MTDWVGLEAAGIAALAAIIGLWWQMRSQRIADTKERHHADLEVAQWRTNIERDVKDLQDANGRHMESLEAHVSDLGSQIKELKRDNERRADRAFGLFDKMGRNISRIAAKINVSEE